MKRVQTDTQEKTTFKKPSFIRVNNTYVSVNRSSFTFVFFKSPCHGNLSAVIKQGGSSSYISRHIFRKFSNTSASNNLSFWTCKSRYYLNLLFQKFANSLFMRVICISNKNLLFYVIRFYWIFPNYPYIHMGKNFFRTTK